MLKKFLSILLSITVLLASFCVVSAEDSTPGSMLILPASLAEIKDEAFEGDDTLEYVVIPNTVKSIGSRAFADCTGITDVVIASRDVEIAEDAFEGCSADIRFSVYPDTTADMFALSNGYPCTLLDSVDGSLSRIMTLVEENGGTSSILESDDFLAMRLIVRLKGNRLPDISRYNPSEIVRDSSDIVFIQFDTVDDTIECYGALYGHELIEFVESDGCVEVLDPVSAAGVTDSNSWGSDDVMGFDVYAPFVEQLGSGSVTVAVIDSGVDRNAYFSSMLRVDGYNFVTDGQGPSGWGYDPLRHGSFVASVIADSVGDANVSILPLRVVGETGTASLTLIGKAIQYAVKCGASIINMSLNCDSSDYISAQIESAKKAGVDVVVAAGNNSKDISKVFPANHEDVVTVSALDTDYTLWAKSNYGSNVAYTAPGTYISAGISSAMRMGTSFACPQIAAALALVELDPYHSVSDMQNTCMDLGTEGTDSLYGYGLPQLDQLANVAVNRITMDVPEVLQINALVPLKYTVEPAVATDKTVTIESSNPNVLRVLNSSDGSVSLYAIQKGTSKLTITSNENSAISVSTDIEVVQPVEKITVNGSGNTLYKTRTMQLTAEVSPEDANNTGVKWTSSNESVATVDQNGFVKPVSTGSVIIRATAADGYGAVGFWNLVVEERPNAESVTIYSEQQNQETGRVEVEPEGTATVYAIVSPDDALQGVTWVAFDGTGSIEISQDGVITPNSEGTATVRAIAANGVYGEIEVVVLLRPIGVAISGENAVYTSETIQLTATVTPDDVTDDTVTWSSSNSSVAEVDENGVVTGIAPGTAYIIATANGDPSIIASHAVTVANRNFAVTFDANSGTVSQTGMIAEVNVALGTLPTPTKDYYTFLGWTDAADGGNAVTAETVYTVANDITLYAQWKLNDESGWVLQSEVPDGAVVTQTSYSYRETTESTSSSMSGWTSNGSYWKTTQTGSRRYAPDLPSGFNTSHSLYCGFTSPYTETSTSTYRRTVVNNWDGYVYWHWMYNVAYANTTVRMISPRQGSFNADGSSGGLAFNYFYAFFSTTNYPYLDNLYCCSNSMKSYNCAAYCNGLSSSEKASTSGLGTPRFFRFDRYTSTYTDQYLYYKYYRDISYSSSKPSGSYTYTNLTTYVKYRAK